ncbi:MAG: S9 family peptidase [Planctomycetaceae bacterium]|nr:S9 family peptidase [Planctomycetaceae bacterium]
MAALNFMPSESFGQAPQAKYPMTKRGDTVDDYHGTKVADPFRWLEDDNSDETKAWVAAQNKVTFGFLDQIPARDAIRRRLTKIWNFEKFGVPTQRGGKYLFTRNSGLQNQSVLYVASSLAEEPRELLDPNKLSTDGTVALTSYALSDDGKHLAYGIAASGSDWQEWKVRTVDTAQDTTDHLKWIKFSDVSWTPDGGGFFYSRYDAPKEGEQLTGVNYFQKLYYHKLGTPQSDDPLIYERKDQKEWGFDGAVTDDGRFLIISIWRGTERKNQVFYRDLKQTGSPIVELISGFDAQYEFVDNDGGKLWFRTDLDAARYRLISIDVAKPERSAWQEVVPQSDDVLESVHLVGERFFASYLHNAHSLVRTFELTGKPLGEVKLPGIGAVAGFGGRREDRETFYAFTSFTNPTTIYRYDIAKGESSVFRAPTVDFDPNDFETKQVFYSSKDGTQVPMFITHRKGLKLDGRNPTYLYGYGGFNISLTPSFSVSRIAWLEMGGVFAMPNLRGGGEFGREWHEAGMKHRKQNVFDDFIGAAEYLIREKYTSSERLAIAGGSNGGLLVGACMTQRPELYAVALPAVGVMDMLRFQKFTIGWAWVSEYGSADDASQFATLLKYSPLHNLKPGVKYPATLVTTADHDDRVVPAHSFKFAAALQAAQAGDAPTLIRIETSAGHGAGKPTKKLIEEAADVYGFIVKVLGIEPRWEPARLAD